MTISRRAFLRGVAVAGGAAVTGWQHPIARTLTLAPTPSASRYGELLAPDANGLRLPAGFTSRVVARAGEPVGSSAYVWHPAPDGGACFPTPDGGWTYVSNSEVPLAGGVGAIRFGPDGAIVDAGRIAAGTSMNCAGGPTPWGTWLTCEEHDAGLVWECDPSTLPSVAVPRPALGRFKHEAAAVDLARGHVYLTEDQTDGRFYRFGTTAAGERLDLDAGALEVAQWDPATGAVTWLPVPNPDIEPGATPTRQQVPESTAFSGGEGCFFHDGHVYWTTKGDNRVYDLDCATSTLRVIYDAATSPTPVLTGVDNVTVSSAGDIFVAEDGGDMQLCMLAPGRDGTYSVAPILQVVGHDASEITGPAFSPDGTRLYFSSQRGADLPYDAPAKELQSSWKGVTFEVTGPFYAPRRTRQSAGNRDATS